MSLSGKYIKPSILTIEEAKIFLNKTRHYEFDTKIKIESLVMSHFSSEIDDSSYSDGASCRYKNLMVTVCVESPKIYEIVYVIETCDSDYEDSEDFDPITYTHVNIKVLWNCEQNIMLIQMDQLNNIDKLLKKFKSKPSIVSKDIFYCTLAY